MLSHRGSALQNADSAVTKQLHVTTDGQNGAGSVNVKGAVSLVLCQQNHCLHPAGVLQKPPQAGIYTSLLAAPGKGERQHGRKAAQEMQCSDMAFPLRYRPG